MIFIQLFLQLIAVPGIIILSVEICRMYAQMWHEVLKDE